MEKIKLVDLEFADSTQNIIRTKGAECEEQGTYYLILDNSPIERLFCAMPMTTDNNYDTEGLCVVEESLIENKEIHKEILKLLGCNENEIEKYIKQISYYKEGDE